MCGIAGIINLGDVPPPDRAVLGAMAQALAHRGPNDQGVEGGDWWGLANRRLAIIGVADGHQPLSNEDGTVWVTFNGEIYNHHELRAGLAGQGHVFESHTDTEVLVHLYEQYGAAMLERLRGMFAFAVVDTRRQQLFLARDRLGQKPLFYSVQPNRRVVFASELGSLLTCPGIVTEIDVRSLDDYLSLNCVPAPRTIYRDVAKLSPASAATFHRAQPEQVDLIRYWQPCYRPCRQISLGAAIEGTRELLARAVEKRLEAEVPLGAFLSGGVDSSLVAALMQQRDGVRTQTFTIGFDDPRYDESRHAQVVAEYLGTYHRLQVAEPRDIGLLRQLVSHHGEPFSDSSMLPTALLSKFTKEHVTVALSGDGGDELFGGYRRYQVMAFQRYVQSVPRRWRQVFLNLVLRALGDVRHPYTTRATLRRLAVAFRDNDAAAYATFQEVFAEPRKRELMKLNADAADSFPGYVQGWDDVLRHGTATDFVERFLELDTLTYLPDDLLCKVDIASMMFSLEVRCPFMDIELVEFVMSLPRVLKVGLFQRKRLLTECARGHVPDSILARGKHGFGVPVGDWLRGDLVPLLTDMVGTGWDLGGRFNPAVIQRLVDEHVAGRCDHGFRLWSLLCCKLWSEC